jgi:alpha-mannosidase
VVDNTIEDHRLRLLLPTDAKEAKTWLAHHPFDLVERSIALDPQTVTWSEMDLPEKPFLGLQSVGEGTRGLAFLSAGGLHEGGVRDDARRTMQATLMRSYRRTVGTPGEQDGLELGRVTYRYALMPFAGTLPRQEALTELARLQAGVMRRQTGKRPSGYPPMAGKAEPRMSFLTQESGSLVLSSFKPAETGRGLILRLWNPGDEPATEELTFWREVKKASLVKLSEKPIRGGQLAANGHAVSITAHPHAIVTLKVDLKCV